MFSAEGAFDLGCWVQCNLEFVEKLVKWQVVQNGSAFYVIHFLVFSSVGAHAPCFDGAQARSRIGLCLAGMMPRRAPVVGAAFPGGGGSAMCHERRRPPEGSPRCGGQPPFRGRLRGLLDGFPRRVGHGGGEGEVWDDGQLCSPQGEELREGKGLR